MRPAALPCGFILTKRGCGRRPPRAYNRALQFLLRLPHYFLLRSLFIALSALFFIASMFIALSALFLLHFLHYFFASAIPCA